MSNMGKLISVIIPVYNGEKYINECVQSIIQQEYSNIEIIVVNDGSTDDTKAILDDIVSKDDRVKVHTITNHGQGYARNYGMSVANGEYIGFCDADDLIHPQMYSSLMQAAEEYDADMIGCDHSNIIDGQVVYKRPNKDKEYHFVNRSDALRGFAFREYIAWGVWDKVFKRDKLNGISFPNVKVHAEDTMFILDFIKNNEKFCYAGLGYYYHNDGNTQSYTKQAWGKSNLGLTSFYSHLYNTLKEYRIDDCAHKAGARYYKNLLSTFIRASRMGLPETPTLLNSMKNEIKDIKKEKSLRWIYRVDIWICVTCPWLGKVINFWHK